MPKSATQDNTSATSSCAAEQQHRTVSDVLSEPAATASQTKITHSGFITIIGRPNVGKSTLLNTLLGQHLAIATRKPQTTRHSIMGVDSHQHTQMIYVDTPGIHHEHKRPLNRYMNKVAQRALKDVDIILWVVSGTQWQAEEDHIAKLVKQQPAKVILVINKVDLIADKESLLPYIKRLEATETFDQLVLVSAKKQQYITELKQIILDYIPPGPAYFPVDQLTNRSSSFLAAELLREQLILQLSQELPYSTAVSIEQMKRERSCLRIAAVIWVAKSSQKPLIIGKEGANLKRISTSARLKMQVFFKSKVFLQVWIKVKKNWMDDSSTLKEVGLDE